MNCIVCRCQLVLGTNWSESRKKQSMHKCNDCANEYNRAAKAQVKLEVFMHYGKGKCACCGEEDLRFLTMDHILGGGGQHRRASSGERGRQ